MSLVRKVGKRLVSRIAKVVSGNELFEKEGERPSQSVMAPPTPTPKAAPKKAAAKKAAPKKAAAKKAAPKKAAPKKAAAKKAVTSSYIAVPKDIPTRCTVADIARLQSALAAGGGVRIVNHWATWCIPCTEEFPQLNELAATLQGSAIVFGISWDMFDPRGDEEDIIEHVENYAEGHDVAHPSLLISEKISPTKFFSEVGVEYDKIPQTWVVDAAGVVVHRLHGELDKESTTAIEKLVAELV